MLPHLLAANPPAHVCFTSHACNPPTGTLHPTLSTPHIHLPTLQPGGERCSTGSSSSSLPSVLAAGQLHLQQGGEAGQQVQAGIEGGRGQHAEPAVLGRSALSVRHQGRHQLVLSHQLSQHVHQRGCKGGRAGRAGQE